METDALNSSCLGPRLDTDASFERRDFAPAILSTVGALVVVLDKSGRIMEFNKACEQLTGYCLEEVQGQVMWDVLLVKEEVDSVKSVFASLTAGDFPNNFENFWLTRNGERRLIAWSNTALLEEQTGGVAYVIGTGIDITDRRRAETALRSSEEQLRLITDNLPVLISYLDSQRRYRFNNRAYEQWFDVRREAIYGKHARDVLGSAAYEEVEDKMAQALSGSEVNFESLVPYKTAGERYVNANYIPHTDSNGTVLGFFVLIQDITARKRAEERARLYHEELAHVTRLTAMGELATGLAHELNQPLAAIHCYAQAALSAGGAHDGLTPHDDHRSVLEKILHQADRAGRIIQRMRDMVRKRDVTKSPVSVNEMVQSIVDLIQPNLRRDGIRLKLKLEKTSTAIAADNIQLSQVLLNLSTNAIQAMAACDKAKKQLTIETNFFADHILITVSDTGPGMEAKTLEQAFDPFVTTKGETGLGMGLPISRSIIEAHQGRLWAESEPGQGTNFFIRLPRQADTQNSATVP